METSQLTLQLTFQRKYSLQYINVCFSLIFQSVLHDSEFKSDFNNPFIGLQAINRKINKNSHPDSSIDVGSYNAVPQWVLQIGVPVRVH